MCIHKQSKDSKEFYLKARKKSYVSQKGARSNLFSSFFYYYSRLNKKVLICLVIFSLLITSFSSLGAEKTKEQKAEELRTELNNRIEELDNQIEKYRGTIREIKNQSNTLEREINLLDNQIGEFALEIQRIELIIKSIESEIEEVEIRAREIKQQAKDEKMILAEIIREIYKCDETSFLEIALTKKRLSDFFSEIQALESLQLNIQKSLEKIRILKEELEFRKIKLEENKNEMIALKAVQEIQKYSIEKKRKERKKLLNETQGQEYLYQRLVNTKKMNISTIRSQLYILQGMGGSLNFENALTIAESASSITGVRPAFLLAVLSKESGLGKNVGTGTWRADMNPNQHSAYLAICSKLGLNPDLMPVSKKAWYGWGGAMGPAQFLPKTWLGYEKRIISATGHGLPSPWNIEDAFIASGFYLANAGATTHSYEAEHKAYMKYLAGSNWWKSHLQFIGDSVMELAATFQEQINLIK